MWQWRLPSSLFRETAPKKCETNLGSNLMPQMTQRSVSPETQANLHMALWRLLSINVRVHLRMVSNCSGNMAEAIPCTEFTRSSILNFALKFWIRIFFSLGLMSSKGTLIGLIGSYMLYVLFMSCLVKELADRWRGRKNKEEIELKAIKLMQ